jgi:hypothetical protein
MGVCLILNLLNQLNKIILCEPMASITLFYSMTSINLVLNRHDYNILFITYILKKNGKLLKRFIFH